ncbi:MAG TPA: GNAT family N-acetyltransferase [Rudaea sp.]|nr:GNAT family N-acetyltransferase [Rudaea sp.]
MNATVPLATFAFETERLRMRPLEEGDEALFVGLYTDAETMRFVGPALTREEAARTFRRMLSQGRRGKPMFLTIVEKSFGHKVGMCGVPAFDAHAADLEIGIMLCREARGRGYSKEGLAGLTQRLFATLPVQELWVEYASEHEIVDRFMRSIGFSPNATRSSRAKRIRSAYRGTWVHNGRATAEICA